MESKVLFETVAPVIPVRDLAIALERYRRLGFSVRQDDGDPGYGFVRRGSVSFHLTEWDEHDPARTAAAVYVYVSDADALHDEWAGVDVGGDLREPRDTPYGLREFAYIDPDGTLHRVGSPIEP